MPFYLYGNSEEIHLDHMLLHAPNVQISANNVTVELDGMELGILASDLRNGLIAIADTLPEHLLQPFTAEHRPNFFRPGFKVGVTIYHDRSTSSAPGPGLVESLSSPLARGAITLGDSIFIDSNVINVKTPLVASHVPKRNSFLLRTTLTSVGLASNGIWMLYFLIRTKTSGVKGGIFPLPNDSL